MNSSWRYGFPHLNGIYGLTIPFCKGTVPPKPLLIFRGTELCDDAADIVVVLIWKGLVTLDGCLFLHSIVPKRSASLKTEWYPTAA